MRPVLAAVFGESQASAISEIFLPSLYSFTALSILKRMPCFASRAAGLIPLNDSIAIEVRSRAPLANLERILLLVPRYAPEILERRKREFGLAEIPTPSLLDLLAVRLLEATAKTSDGSTRAGLGRRRVLRY